MPSTVNQAYVFLATVYAGFVMGFIYDLFRMIRHITKPGKFITAVLDLLFWVIMGLLAFAVIFYVNYGEVRIYTIIGLAMGWALYALTLSPVIFRVMLFIYKGISWVWAQAVKVMLWPFRLAGRVIGRLLPKFSLKKDAEKPVE
ncbi:MAG TPA: spore cortex biosynthesis protein YabQ [Candidatus Atribacteria bacterium]|nr:spore cortex biosynthesis protein YabQ [Candidatus Atribacteria bacterium]